jgi:hypothetical protein
VQSHGFRGGLAVMEKRRIGTQTELDISRHELKKKHGVVSLTDLMGMDDSYRWKLLESYSLKEIESIICSVPEQAFDSRFCIFEKQIFKQIMLVRRKKLNRKFKWTLENKNRIAKVSDEFIKAWEEGFSKAKVIIDTLYKKEQNKDKDSFKKKYSIEIILYPEIVKFKEDGTYTEEQLYYVITGFIVGHRALSMRIGSDPKKNEDSFRQSTHINRDLSWNIEGLGDIELEDYYICYALHILYDHYVWALEDIASINSISSEIQINYDGEEF